MCRWRSNVVSAITGMKPIKTLITLATLFFAATTYANPAGAWQSWRAGVDVAYFNQAGDAVRASDDAITVVRVDPAHMNFRVLTAAAHGGRLNAEQWAKQHQQTCTINAGMYHRNGTHTGMLKTGNTYHNAKLAKSYKSVIVFNPKRRRAPAFKILDGSCDRLSKNALYADAVQNIRALSCTGKNVWKPRAEKWSMALMGQDGSGRALLMFSRTPYTVHGFIRYAKTLPIDLQRAAYLEGAHVAQLYCRDGDKVIDLVGHFRGSNASLGNSIRWEIPNVIGVAPK